VSYWLFEFALKTHFAKNRNANAALGVLPMKKMKKFYDVKGKKRVF
jgi:hypothetical protein